MVEHITSSTTEGAGDSSAPVTPSALAEGIGISVSFASQILSGTRKPSTDHALAAFRKFNIRLGFLAEMTADDIEQLCTQHCAKAAA